jgi:hypothetical protein
MNLLSAVNYDPAVAVTKATSALLAMTAVDTTNLRLAITVPSHGIVRFRLQCNLSGATTMPQILLGVLNGATVLGRQVPLAALPGTALATTNVPLVADFIATGLTPGAMNVDAAYGVETIVAATNIHYGGPNDTTVNNAWGGFAFEAWDPRPVPTATPGAANGLLICGSNAATTVNITGSLSGSVGSVTGSVGSVTGLTASNLDVAVSSRMATFTLPTNFSSLLITNVGSVTAGTVSDKTGYSLSQTFPTNFSSLSITAGGAVTAGTVSDKTGYALTSAYDAAKTALPASSYTAPDNASVAAIKTKTDSLAFTVSGKVDSNLLYVNGSAITGSGTSVSPWGPA